MDQNEYNYWNLKLDNATMELQILNIKKEFWELKLKMLKHENVEIINKDRI